MLFCGVKCPVFVEMPLTTVTTIRVMLTGSLKKFIAMMKPISYPCVYYFQRINWLQADVHTVTSVCGALCRCE